MAELFSGLLEPKGPIELTELVKLLKSRDILLCLNYMITIVYWLFHSHMDEID